MNKVAIWAPFRGHVGTEKAMVNYAQYFKNKGYRVTFIQLCDEFSAYNGDYDLISLWPTFMHFIGKTNLLKRRDFFLLAFLSIKRLKNVIRENNYDIFVTSLLSSVASKALSDLSNPPISVCSVQGYPKFFLQTPSSYFSRFENYIRKRLWLNNYSKFDAIIAMTDYTYQKISSLLPDKKKYLCTIPNPLFDKSYNSQIGISKKILHSKSFDIVFVGRFSSQKRFDTFLALYESYSSHLKCEFSFKFHVFGQFPPFLIRKYSRDDFLFHGYKLDFWRAFSPYTTIHVVSSDWEDPGHAMLESISLRIPTLLVDSQSPHIDIGKNYNLPISPRNSSQIYSELLRIASNVDSLRIRSREATEDFSRENFQNKMNTLLNTLSC